MFGSHDWLTSSNELRPVTYGPRIGMIAIGENQPLSMTLEQTERVLISMTPSEANGSSPQIRTEK